MRKAVLESICGHYGIDKYKGLSLIGKSFSFCLCKSEHTTYDIKTKQKGD